MLIFRRFSFWLSLLGIGAAALVCLSITKPEPLPEPPISPSTNPYKNGGIGASSIVESERENTQVGVPSEGIIQEVLVKVWDRVEAGTPLIRLDESELRASLLVQEDNLRVAEAQLARIKAQLTRSEKLGAGRVISEDELTTRRYDAAICEAQLKVARSEVSRTKILLERLTIRAPISGTILQVNVRVGEHVSSSPSFTPIVIGNIDELQVRADVDEQLAPRIRVGNTAIGYLRGDTKNPIKMEFVRIEPFVVPKQSLTGLSTERVDTRVLQVIYKFPQSAGHSIYVGQQMDIFIED